MNKIDNNKYYNTALAYDFELFMPRPVDKQPKKAEIIKIKPKQKKRPVNAVYIVALIIYMICLVFSIFLKAKINETQSEINDISAEIQRAQSQSTALKCELESIISYSNLEFEATKLGMQKARREQVHYIKTKDRDMAIIDGKEVFAKNP